MHVDDQRAIRHEMEVALHSLVDEAVDGRYRIDSALNVLQGVVNGLASQVTAMEASAKSASTINSAMVDVRSCLDQAVSYVYQAAQVLERVG